MGPVAGSLRPVVGVTRPSAGRFAVRRSRTEVRVAPRSLPASPLTSALGAETSLEGGPRRGVSSARGRRHPAFGRPLRGSSLAYGGTRRSSFLDHEPVDLSARRRNELGARAPSPGGRFGPWSASPGLRPAASRFFARAWRRLVRVDAASYVPPGRCRQIEGGAGVSQAHHHRAGARAHLPDG